MDDARTVFLNCEEFNEDDSEVSHVTYTVKLRSSWSQIELSVPCYIIVHDVHDLIFLYLFLQVGQAGKRLFQFFERRWEELAPNMDWGSGGRYEFSFSFLVFPHARSTLVCRRILSAGKLICHLGFGNCGGMVWGKICQGRRRAPILYRLSIQSKMAASKTSCTASYLPSLTKLTFPCEVSFLTYVCLFVFINRFAEMKWE